MGGPQPRRLSGSGWPSPPQQETRCGVVFSFTMFGDLFEEDYSSVSSNQYGKGRKLKTKTVEPPAPREFTNLSGIRNQGGTCYLNSLLQTLHFTPEFRELQSRPGPGSFCLRTSPGAAPSGPAWRVIPCVQGL
ncbi:ubiquitin carboxyl-terminal hydrolase 40-like isoform 2-T4 [Molossus nigricans]